MQDADPRLNRILRLLIARSLPRLRRLPIAIVWGVQESELMSYVEEGGRYSIRVNNCLREASRVALEGGIAHELCHIDADIRLGPSQRRLAWDLYLRSRWSRMKEERATERRVIALGYGPHLLTFVRYARRLGHSFSREHGLLYAEISRAVTTGHIVLA